jgi:hypothetical protein
MCFLGFSAGTLMHAPSPLSPAVIRFGGETPLRALNSNLSVWYPHLPPKKYACPQKWVVQQQPRQRQGTVNFKNRSTESIRGEIIATVNYTPKITSHDSIYLTAVLRFESRVSPCFGLSLLPDPAEQFWPRLTHFSSQHAICPKSSTPHHGGETL